MRRCADLSSHRRLPLLLYSHEPNEPPHVHVDRGDASAKLWLWPVALARNLGFRAHELTRITKRSFWERGMGISALAADERVADVRFDADRIVVNLMDGRTIAALLAWYPRLTAASPDERSHWERAGGGYGLHCPDLDEDLSTKGLLGGGGRSSEAGRAAG